MSSTLSCSAWYWVDSAPEASCVCACVCVYECVCSGRGEDRAPHCLPRQGCSPAGLTGRLCAPHIWTPPQQAAHCALPYEIKRTFITGALILLCPRSPSISRPKSHPQRVREDHTIICAIQSEGGGGGGHHTQTHSHALWCKSSCISFFMPATWCLKKPHNDKAV